MSRAGGKVLNPYHFVPVKRPGRDRIDLERFHQGEPAHVGHERYVEGTYSGRLLCRLSAETPMFIGSERVQDASESEPARVDPFQLDDAPGLPATSLRGLVSSLAEAASNSSLRVLSDWSLSYRRKPGHALSAVGMIERNPDSDGPEYSLRPLALPTLQAQPGEGATLRPKWNFFAHLPPLLKVHVGSSQEIRRQSFQYRTYDPREPEYFGLRLAEQQWETVATRGVQLAHDPDSQVRIEPGKTAYVVAQKPLERHARPLPWESIDPGERSSYTRGIMRVLGCWGAREDDIPDGKKHELFIPYPEELEEKYPSLPIPDHVVETFHRIADERTGDRDPEHPAPLPYEPKDTQRRPAEDDDNRLRLKPGDLVFFEPSEDGREVAEISLSSIWRGVPRRGQGAALQSASTHDFFEEIDPELLPFHDGRETLTPAEQIFGFVGRDKASAEHTPAALKGRVRFSFGRLEPETEEPFYLDPCILQILASPKPPSPELYFKDDRRYEHSIERDEEPRGSFVAADDLNASHHAPQGRKLYLHQHSGGSSGPWKTDHENNLLQMKTKIRPWRRGLGFLFHIDFDNLSRQDLALLCYAVRPTEDFRHKLGMGKPIGLGTVRIDPVGLFLVDRRRRYGEDGFFEPRYHEAWLAEGDAIPDPASWPDSYGHEKQAAAAQPGRSIATAPSPRDLANEYRQSVDPDIRQALELLGETTSPGHPVATPQVAGADREEETFRWFVNNRRPDNEHQGLAPLSRNSQSLPSLDEPPESQ